MTAASGVIATQGRLPPLGGGLLWLYRVLWATLALAALLVHALLLTEPAMEPVVLALRLVKAAVIFSVVTMLFRKKQRDPVAALLSLAFLCWTITSSFDFAAADLWPMLLDRIRFMLFALALLLFPDGEWRPSWGRHVAFSSIVVAGLGILEAARLLPTHLFLPLAIGCVLAAVAALLECYRTASSEVLRQQMKWVALGLVSGISLILGARAGDAFSHGTASLALPAIWEGMFEAGIVIIAGGFLVSLLRYRLFDAETAISRSAAYATLTISLVAVFAATEATVENVGQTYFGMGLGNVSAAAAAAVAAVLLNPLHERIGGWAERRFQRDLVLLKTELPPLLEDIAVSVSPNELGDAVLPRICEAIHARRAGLLVDGSLISVVGIDRPPTRREQPVDRRLSQIFPVRVPLGCPFSRLQGSLLLGPRPDGSLPGKDDMNAVEHILPALRRALIVSTAREEMRTENLRASRRATQKINELHARVFALERVARRTA